MATSLIKRECKKVRVWVECLKTLEKEKADFFRSEWNRRGEKEEKEKDRHGMLQAEKKRN